MKSRHRLPTLVLLGSLVLCPCIAPSSFAAEEPAASEGNLEPAQQNARASKPVNPALIEVEDVAGLPRVLLIGDSISMGYTLPVREKLKGKANVHRALENCGDTARGLAKVDKWLGQSKWDVIHFNFGLHDLKYLNDKGQYVEPKDGKQVAPPEVYRERLRTLTERLKKTGAKLIFATTTPVPPGTLGRVPGDEAIYNKVALEVMKELDVPVEDLCALALAARKKLPLHKLSEKPEGRRHIALRPGDFQLPFNVHFTPEGYDQMADLVVANIGKQLPSVH